MRRFGGVEVNNHEAKTHLSPVAAGEEIGIARAGEWIARLVPFRKPKGERPLGIDKGLFEIPEDFDALLPEHLPTDFGVIQGRGSC
jgi:antitoxin (DNA-binding transcriptional repressor) of toxin-antitoxin stability system